MSCPALELLEGWQDGGLAAPAAAAVEAHLEVCPACASTVRDVEAGRFFARLPVSELELREWAPMMAAVRAEVEANPRGRAAGSGWFEGIAAAFRLLPAALASAAILFGLVWVAWSPLPPERQALSRGDALRAQRPAASAFVYLSNPEAAVTQAVTASGHAADSVVVTMVIDARVADGF